MTSNVSYLGSRSLASRPVLATLILLHYRNKYPYLFIVYLLIVLDAVLQLGLR